MENIHFVTQTERQHARHSCCVCDAACLTLLHCCIMLADSQDMSDLQQFSSDGICNGSLPFLLSQLQHVCHNAWQVAVRHAVQQTPHSPLKLTQPPCRSLSCCSCSWRNILLTGRFNCMPGSPFSQVQSKPRVAFSSCRECHSAREGQRHNQQGNTCSANVYSLTCLMHKPGSLNMTS